MNTDTRIPPPVEGPSATTPQAAVRPEVRWQLPEPRVKYLGAVGRGGEAAQLLLPPVITHDYKVVLVERDRRVADLERELAGRRAAFLAESPLAQAWRDACGDLARHGDKVAGLKQEVAAKEAAAREAVRAGGDPGPYLDAAGVAERHLKAYAAITPEKEAAAREARGRVQAALTGEQRAHFQARRAGFQQ